MVGLGRSGAAGASLLVEQGCSVLVAERDTEPAATRKPATQRLCTSLRQLGIEVHFGLDGERLLPLLSDVGLAVLSPGVSLESAVVGTLSRLKIPFISELDLAAALHKGEVAVITGSNGKSTTAALVSHALRCAGRSVQGSPSPELSAASASSGQEGALGPDGAVLVLPATSFELESCTILKPNVSVLLNLSESHLERHGSMERYASAKARCVRLQEKNDVVVANADDPAALSLAAASGAATWLFGRKPLSELLKSAQSAATIIDQNTSEARLEARIRGAVESYSLTSTALFGEHNRSNIAAAVLAARALGAPAAAVQAAVSSFKPLEHRLEIISHNQARVVVNDSKSTTVAASRAALRAVLSHFPGHTVILMLGGLSKAGAWEPLLREVSSLGPLVEPLICFGKDRTLLASHCRANGVASKVAANLREATGLALARLHSLERAVVLLSPGCHSFDEFEDFRERGRQFKSYVEAAGIEPCRALG